MAYLGGYPGYGASYGASYSASYGAGCGCGGGYSYKGFNTNIGTILVLFILLVIISRAFF